MTITSWLAFRTTL